MENTSTGDRLYTWSIRGLYAAAIALNVWYLAEQYRQTEEGKTILSRVERAVKKFRRPLYEAKRLRRLADETLIEAWVIVDEAKKGSED